MGFGERFSPRSFVVVKSKTQTQASRALYILLNTSKYFKYLGRREWLNHGGKCTNTTPKSTRHNTKKYTTQHQKVPDTTPKSTRHNTKKYTTHYKQCYNSF
ncbi:hypothetical protein FAM8407_02893 [Lacticaseibacillus paracasei]|nr:hypothetical protein FAM8407_02893 [Lacticaseibacillus paracasei]